MRKFLDVIAVLSFLISGSMVCGSFYLYKTVTSPGFKEKVVKQLMGNALPGQINKLPIKSGVSLPF